MAHILEMDATAILEVVLLLAITIGLIVGPILLAFYFERKRKKTAPTETKPYAWGYYFAIGHFFIGLICAPAVLFGQTPIDTNLAIGIAVMVCWIILSYFVFQRRFWACIVLTILSANPILWVINTVYFINRKAELS
jgi:hypothetical protein